MKPTSSSNDRTYPYSIPNKLQQDITKMNMIAAAPSMTTSNLPFHISTLLFYKWPVPFCLDVQTSSHKLSDNSRFSWWGIHFHPISHSVKGQQRITSLQLSICTGRVCLDIMVEYHNKQSKANLWSDSHWGELLHPEREDDRVLLQDALMEFIGSEDHAAGLPWIVPGYSNEELSGFRTAHERTIVNLKRFSGLMVPGRTW